jgi:hypothetical protein
VARQRPASVSPSEPVASIPRRQVRRDRAAARERLLRALRERLHL